MSNSMEDWEKVRIQAAIAAMQGMISAGCELEYMQECAVEAVNFAFDLVHELRKTEGRMPLEVKREELLP
jgi:hypothetical protein